MDPILGVRELSADDVARSSPPPDPSSLQRVYQIELARVLRGRRLLSTGLFALFIGVASLLEWAYHPDRTGTVAQLYLAEIMVCLVGLLAHRSRRLQHHVRVISILTSATLACLMNLYMAMVGEQVVIPVIMQVCFISALGVLHPWSGSAQLAVCAASLGSFALSAPYLNWNIPPAYALLALASGATTSVIGASAFDRARFEAFARNALLAHASTLQREDAQVSGALLHLGQTLDANLGRENIVDRLTTLAGELLGCDSCSILILQPERQVFELVTSSGHAPETLTTLAEMAFPVDWPLFGALHPGHLLEIPDVAQQSLVPLELMRFLERTAALYAPLHRDGQLIGVIAFGRRTAGAFSSRQHRLAFGIAHAAAISIQNDRLIADLQAANKLKSEFLATMSHELRTPLGAITGYADILAEHGYGPLNAEQDDTVASIQRSALELLDLVSETLDLNRLEAGRDTVVIGPVDIDALFAEVSSELRTLVQGHAVRWLNALPAPLVASDRAKLKTILKNLVGNALKFTPAGKVEITAATTNGYLTLTVHDTGIGIAPADLPTIFDMFRQGDSSATRRFGGVGLGLHIVKVLVERLGGTVSVESTPGVGSTFTVILPAPPSASASASSDGTRAET
jgi:signal transduction histidine kinase